MRPGHIIGHVVHFAEPFVVFIQVPVGEKDFIYYVIRYFVSKRMFAYKFLKKEILTEQTYQCVSKSV